jgi:hypothetical protein
MWTACWPLWQAWMAYASSMLGGVVSGMVADFLHVAACLAGGPSGLTALAASVVAGVALAAAFVLLASVTRTSRSAGVLPMQRRAAALRQKSWRAGFLRQRDPDARGRSRPRAPSAAPAAAAS